jgi:hypothetical protein
MPSSVLPTDTRQQIPGFETVYSAATHMWFCLCERSFGLKAGLFLSFNRNYKILLTYRLLKTL